MNKIPKYYNVCDESIYIVLKCFVENKFIDIRDLHPCLTKESEYETKKHAVKVGYIEVLNINETLDKNIFWTNPRITDKGLKFLDNYKHFSNIYELGNNIIFEP